MKKIIVAVFTSVLFLTTANAQKINQKDAREFLEKVWGYVKTSDTTAFINLWPSEDSTWQKYHVPYDRKKLANSFIELNGFLAKALSENLNIDHIEIGKEDAHGFEITAVFKTNEHREMGFSLHVTYLKDKWIPRGEPAVLYMTRDIK